MTALAAGSYLEGVAEAAKPDGKPNSSQPYEPMPQNKKSPAGPKKRGYALDAGDLLGGILSETQDEAAAEEQKLKEKLRARQEAGHRAKAEEIERKKREAEAALAEENARQEAAAVLRNRVQQVVEELEHEAASGTLQAVEDLPPPRSRPLDYATDVRASQSYMHPAVTAGRRWMLAAILVTLMLILGGGATVAVLMLSGPSIDPNSYPKTSVSLEGVTNNGTVTVALNMVPEPEPEPTLTPEQIEAAQTASNDRTRERHRERDRDRRRDRDDDESGRTVPLDLSLDGSGIFDRGSD